MIKRYISNTFIRYTVGNSDLVDLPSDLCAEHILKHNYRRKEIPRSNLIMVAILVLYAVNIKLKNAEEKKGLH